MSYPFCGCCKRNVDGRPAADCGRCAVLQQQAEDDRRRKKE